MERPRGNGWVGGVNLFIFRGGVPVAAARVRDAHRRGLSIETRYTGYRLLQALELCLTLGREQGACAYRFAPLVSRRGHSGLGLTVVEHDEQGALALGALLAARDAVTGPHRAAQAWR
jgi:hypothetical protein